MLNIFTNNMRPNFLPFCLPSIGEEEKRELLDTLESGWLSTGPKTKRFEENIAKYVGSKHAIAVNSCTAALHLSLVTGGIEKGDEVITSPFTFASTANVVLHQGARPVFVDIDRKTFNIDPNKIEEAITPKTKAIIPVHFAGQPCEMDKILEIADTHGLKVFEDCAHSIGASYKGKMSGTHGDTGCYSFYAIKNMTTGEGGMLVTDNDDIAEKARIYSLHGISKDAWKRYTSSGSWYYELVYPGFKYNMMDIQASLGIHQLIKLSKFIEIREKYAKTYDENFADLGYITTPFVNGNVSHARHLYPILLDIDRLKINRAQFIELLKESNIGATVNFIPIPLHPYYAKTFGYSRGAYPVSEWVYDRIVSLPLYPKMTPDDINYVSSTVRKIIVDNIK